MNPRHPRWRVSWIKVEPQRFGLQLTSIAPCGKLTINAMMEMAREQLGVGGWRFMHADETNADLNWSGSLSLAIIDAASSGRDPFLGTLQKERAANHFFDYDDQWQLFTHDLRGLIETGALPPKIWTRSIGPDLALDADLRVLVDRQFPGIYELSRAFSTWRNSAVIVSSSDLLRSR